MSLSRSSSAGKTGEYLRAHEERLGKESDRVSGWRKGLVELANLSGWHFTKGIEVKLIRTIVEEVSSKLNRPTLSVATYPVGVDDAVEDMKGVLGIGLDDVRMIGLYGIGGIGKSTMAKAIFNLHADSFGGSSFLENVKDVSRQHGIARVQETLLFEAIGEASIRLGSADRGIMMLSHRLRNKKVLVVVDDIDHLDQLRKLAGDKNWFGPGSRIIITTRDKHLLEAHGVDYCHEVKELNYLESYRLFCWNAFRKPDPPEDFKDLTKSIIEYAKGLPLAIIVLGSFLCNRNAKEWNSAIARLKNVPNREYNEILKISYDGLDDLEKAIFLDIACFFNGDDEDYVMKVFDSCEFFPDIGVRVLVDKSLVSVEKNKLRMHDLLQEMGREIVRKESPNNPGERSRLWYSEDAIDVLTENLGTNKMEAIKLVVPDNEEVFLNAKAFKRMRRLRLLIISNASIAGDFGYLSNNLRWVEWEGYPLPSLPLNFHPKKLVGLFLPNSHVKNLGERFEVFKNLKHLSFEGSRTLTEVPDFSTIPLLESLNLIHCSSLVEVHDSVGLLEKLVTLNLEYCFNLMKLPRRLKLKSLETLLLTRCRILESFPESLEDMESLKELRLSKTAIKELPPSIEKLVGLQIFDVSGCKRLKGLPEGIHKMSLLKHLAFRDCFELGTFFGHPTKGTSLQKRSLPELLALQSLNIQNCNLGELSFLGNLGCIATLEELELSRNNFVRLPGWISELSKLQKLQVDFCAQLQELPRVPQTIRKISAVNCESLERFEQLSDAARLHTKDLSCLETVNLTNCRRLAQHMGKDVANILLNQDHNFGITLPGDEIPEWFKYQTQNGFFFFQLQDDLFEDLIGFAFCAVVTESFDCDLNAQINGERVMYAVESFSLLESDHLWMAYFPCPIVKPRTGWNYIEFNVEEFNSTELFTIGKFISRCGIFLEFKRNGALNWSLEDGRLSVSHELAVMYDEDSNATTMEDSDGSECSV
ncbi:hypothetical protein MLD38_023177 [Melastoma candidum]|uniref:Uncharacterized protein n=1 Tax=Melastoma candidum TaxID=119954 RepID=A0ACB9QLK4_9MYRT|nr:hypothetical protein MLD38_023177 [Melastoma candidum]